MDGPGDPALRRLWWAVPTAGVLVLALLGMMFGSPPKAPREGSSFDASPLGVRAAYLLLQNLSYDVAVSKRAGAGKARWILFPQVTKGEGPGVEPVLQAGGRVLIADDKPGFADALGLKVQIEAESAKEVDLTIAGATLRLAPGLVGVTTRREPDRVWPPGAGEPLVGIFRHAAGELWLVYRPEFLRNERLRDADNAVIVCRLAEAFAGRHRIDFDEYFHGMRDRPGVAELLFQPPALWITLESLGLLAILLWHFVPRFGPLLPSQDPRRRSKEEYVDALAHLLEVKGAYFEAFTGVRDGLAREMEHALQLPPDTPADELAAAAFGSGPDAASLVRELGRERFGRGTRDYLEAINELERLRRAFFHERHNR